MDETLLRGARQGLVNMLGLKKDDKFTIVTDVKTAGETDGAFVAVATEVVGPKKVVVHTLEELGKRPLTELPGQVIGDIKSSGVTMFLAQALGAELETVRKPIVIAATSSGAAHGHCPDFTRRMMAEGMATDYNIVYALSAALKDMLSEVRRINVTSEAGTNLIVDTLPDQFPWVASEPVKRGSMANFPDGEVFCYPFNITGTAVVDGCVGDYLCAKYGAISKTPVIFEIQNGIVVGINCPGNLALQQELRTYVWNEDGTREFLTRRVGEFALGTNIGLTGVKKNISTFSVAVLTFIVGDKSQILILISSFNAPMRN